MSVHRPLIGISACFSDGDPEGIIFNGRPQYYLERSLAQFPQRVGAVGVMLIPPVDPVDARSLVRAVDAVIIAGGVDMSPTSYGEEALDPAWEGDAERDAFEIALVHAAQAERKPLLGICRGMQVLNVALGGSLYQDLSTQLPGCLEHRNAKLYERLEHELTIEPGSTLAAAFGAKTKGRINSVHHQGIKKLAEGLVVEARSSADQVIEAVYAPPSASTPPLWGVQWHPEFKTDHDTHLLDPLAVLQRLVDAI